MAGEHDGGIASGDDAVAGEVRQEPPDLAGLRVVTVRQSVYVTGEFVERAWPRAGSVLCGQRPDLCFGAVRRAMEGASDDRGVGRRERMALS